MRKKIWTISAISILALVSTGVTPNAQAAPAAYVNDCAYPAYKPQSLTQYCADAGTGVVKILLDKAGKTSSYTINSGFVEVLNNQVSVLVEGATEA